MATVLDYFEANAQIITRASYPNVYIVCPSCQTRQAKFGFHVEKGVGRCFRASCGYTATFPKLISDLQGIPLARAYQIARNYRDGLRADVQHRLVARRTDYPRNALPLLEAAAKQDTAELALQAATWLSKRGITDRELDEQLIGIGYEDFEVEVQDGPARKIPMRGMAVVPIILNQEILSYVARSIEAPGIGFVASRKHHSALEEEGYLSKGKLLFNFEKAIARPGGLVLVEDVWSAMRLDAAALMGTNLTEDHLLLIRENYRGPVTLLMDGDGGGRRAQKKIALQLLNWFQDVRIAELPDDLDPDDDIALSCKLIAAAKPADPLRMMLR